jgi:hypothetical protein
MNKYMGFFELREISIPTVQWKLFNESTKLEDNMLWTVRVAIENGNDLNLPRAVGVASDEAMRKGKEFLSSYSGKGMVVYYPYFIANKSGVIEVTSLNTVVEAVKDDLWNLVTYGKRNITVVIPANGDDEYSFSGERDFLSKDEMKDLIRYGMIIRRRFREDIIDGKSIFAEWSYAFNTDVTKEPIGQRYLVFYELRSV